MKPALPAHRLPDDVLDAAAKEIAAEVAHHLKLMYPEATQAIAWNSCKRSLSGLIRNSMRRLGDAAERGTFNKEVAAMRSARSRRDAQQRDQQAFRETFARDVTARQHQEDRET